MFFGFHDTWPSYILQYRSIEHAINEALARSTEHRGACIGGEVVWRTSKPKRHNHLFFSAHPCDDQNNHNVSGTTAFGLGASIDDMCIRPPFAHDRLSDHVHGSSFFYRGIFGIRSRFAIHIPNEKTVHGRSRVVIRPAANVRSMRVSHLSPTRRLFDTPFFVRVISRRPINIGYPAHIFILQQTDTIQTLICVLPWCGIFPNVELW